MVKVPCSKRSETNLSKSINFIQHQREERHLHTVYMYIYMQVTKYNIIMCTYMHKTRVYVWVCARTTISGLICVLKFSYSVIKQ